jgi:predicted nucleic acid-binding protein
MSYVTDTHALVWYFTNDKRLGTSAKQVFDKASAGNAVVLIPTIVLAELLYIARGKRPALTFQETVERIESGSNYKIAVLDLLVLQKADGITAELELHDRLIVATAQLADGILISKDLSIQSSGTVRTIWD